MEWRNRTDERKNGTEEGVQLFENEHMGERGSKEKNDFYNKFRYLALYINMNNIPIGSIRQALFLVSVLTAKPVFVVSVLTAKTVFVVSVGLRVFQKIKILPIF